MELDPTARPSFAQLTPVLREIQARTAARASASAAASHLRHTLHAASERPGQVGFQGQKMLSVSRVDRFLQGLLDRLVSMDQGTSSGCPEWQLRWLLSGTAGQMAVCVGAARNSCCTPRQWQHAEPLNPARNTAAGLPSLSHARLDQACHCPDSSWSEVWRKTRCLTPKSLPARRLEARRWRVQRPTASPAAAAAAHESTTRCSCTEQGPEKASWPGRHTKEHSGLKGQSMPMTRWPIRRPRRSGTGGLQQGSRAQVAAVQSATEDKAGLSKGWRL